MKKRSGDYIKYLIESLKDPVEAANYLNAALEEKDDPQAFLVALRNVAEAQGMGKVAKAADLNRESFSRLVQRQSVIRVVNDIVASFVGFLKFFDIGKSGGCQFF